MCSGDMDVILADMDVCFVELAWRPLKPMDKVKTTEHLHVLALSIKFVEGWKFFFCFTGRANCSTVSVDAIIFVSILMCF